MWVVVSFNEGRCTGQAAVEKDIVGEMVDAQGKKGPPIRASLVFSVF